MAQEHAEPRERGRAGLARQRDERRHGGPVHEVDDDLLRVQRRQREEVAMDGRGVHEEVGVDVLIDQAGFACARPSEGDGAADVGRSASCGGRAARRSS